MKYKILLTGKNKTVIDDFFSHLDKNIEPMSTSLRWDDIMGHIRYFSPDAFCYCAASENIEHLTQMRMLKTHLEKADIPFIFIGSEEDCAEFRSAADGVADLILQKPLKAALIEEKVIKFIDLVCEKKKKKYEEEERKRQEEEQKRIERERQRLEGQEKLLEEERRRMLLKEKKMQRLAENPDSGGKHHILIVDDDSTMLRAIKEQLHEEYEVATAISGKIALKFLEKKTTDLILLDYEMPVENGPMVLEKLRENEATRDIPVIFLTGVTESEKIMQVLAMKPQGYLLKPIEHDKLMQAIEKVLIGEGNHV